MVCGGFICKLSSLMEQTSFPSCPINSDPQVEELTTRLIAVETTLLIIATLLLNSPWIAALLLIDFLMRSSKLRKWSPLRAIAQFIRPLCKQPRRMINAAPKLFAARIGAFFSLLVLLGIVLSVKPLLYIAAATFALCALLEAAIGFCVACTLYPFVLKWRRK